MAGVFGYKVFYDKDLKTFLYEAKLSEVNTRSFWGDETFWWIDTAQHAKESAEEYSHKLDTGKIQIHICKQCGKSFVLDEKQKDWFIDHDMSLPRRCLKCRNSNKKEEAKWMH